MAQGGLIQSQVRQDAAGQLDAWGIQHKVEIVQLQQRELRDNGFLVDIDIHGVSQFTAKVDWYVDLGINADDERRTTKRLSPGRKNLLPESKFRSLETRLRRNLYKHSIEVSAFGGYRYVPNTAFMDWWDTHQELCEEWDAEVERVCAQWDYLVDEAKIDFGRMARDAWLALIGRNGQGTSGLHHQSMDSFVADAIWLVGEQMPSPSQIRTNTRVTLRPFGTFLTDLEQAQADQEIEDIRGNIQREREERDTFARSEKAWTEQQEAKAREMGELADAARFERWERERVAREKAEIEIAAIKEVQLEIAREAIVDMQNPFADAVAQVRERAYDTTLEVLENVQKHGRVLGKTVQKIETMATMFRALNVVGDGDLEMAIRSLDAALAMPGVDTTRNTGAITTALEQVLAVAESTAEEVAEETTLTGWDMLNI